MPTNLAIEDKINKRSLKIGKHKKSSSKRSFAGVYTQTQTDDDS